MADTLIVPPHIHAPPQFKNSSHPQQHEITRKAAIVSLCHYIFPTVIKQKNTARHKSIRQAWTRRRDTYRTSSLIDAQLKATRLDGTPRPAGGARALALVLHHFNNERLGWASVWKMWSFMERAKVFLDCCLVTPYIFLAVICQRKTDQENSGVSHDYMWWVVRVKMSS